MHEPSLYLVAMQFKWFVGPKSLSQNDFWEKRVDLETYVNVRNSMPGIAE